MNIGTIKGHIRNLGSGNPFFGKQYSVEAKEKMSQAKEGKPWSAARRAAQEKL